MNKLKKIFKHDHSDKGTATSSSAASTSQYASTPAQSGLAAAPAQSNYSSTQPTTQSSAASAVDPAHASGVLLTTNYGPITIALYKDQVPKTTRNFATLCATHKYDNVIFHRIIPGFMIQGGDPTGTGTGGKSIYGGKFEDEFDSSLVHSAKGVLSMANSGPNTNGSQFFITLGPTPHLNGKHTVFGQVVDGMEVVDAIGSVRTGEQDRPVKDVMILKTEVF
ncbi:Peptidyl-prolyl cis-trans isomerase-like 1 [Xylographa soralifera]|nr:Peptidyl-prolyl cis-trans isomerase-like 1 [Xylographa soralifera]